MTRICMKKHKKLIYTVIISWIVGCLPMILLYEILGGREYGISIPDCKGYWDFLAVKFGDQFCLPLLNAGLLLSSDFEVLSSPKYKKKCIIAASIGLIIGIVIQASWILPFRTEGFPGNWTFYMSSKGIVFNSAGWYHGFFFVAELTFIAYMVTRDWLSGVICNRKKHNEIYRTISLAAGTVFICLHNIDDYKQYGQWTIITVTVLLSCVLAIIYIGSQKVVHNKMQKHT